MKTFEFIYIATTDHYRNYFKPFVESLEKFCSNTVYKKIKLLTDDPNYDISQFNSKHNIEVELYYINHYPWPIITLFKMHYIKNFIDDDYDLMFYCNCNYRFYEINDLPKEFSQKNKMLFFQVHKKGEFRHWDNKNWFNNSLPYVLGTLFAGTKEELKKCVDYVVDFIDSEVFNNRIPRKHDEEALNKYYAEISENKDEYEVLYLDDYGALNQSINKNDPNGGWHKNGKLDEKLLYLSDYSKCKPLRILHRQVFKKIGSQNKK